MNVLADECLTIGFGRSRAQIGARNRESQKDSGEQMIVLFKRSFICSPVLFCSEKIFNYPPKRLFSALLYGGIKMRNMKIWRNFQFGA